MRCTCAGGALYDPLSCCKEERSDDVEEEEEEEEMEEDVQSGRGLWCREPYV